MPSNIEALKSRLHHVRRAMESSDVLVVVQKQVDDLWRKVGGPGLVKASFTDLAIFPGKKWQGLNLRFEGLPSPISILIERQGTGFEFLLRGIHGGPRSLGDLVSMADFLPKLVKFSRSLLLALE